MCIIVTNLFWFAEMLFLSFAEMAIITLTSDLGFRDHYAAIVKGAIATAVPNASIIDISHNIAAFDIQQAAYILRSSYRHFPEKTVHVIGVEAEGRSPKRCIAASHDQHFFVCIDNGLMSLVFEEQLHEVVEIAGSAGFKSPFLIKDVLVPAACRLASGKGLNQVGAPTQNVESRMFLNPPEPPDVINAKVVYVDGFGNVILDVTRHKFDRVGRGRSFTIYFKRRETLEKIHTTYNEVPSGERLCLFNSAGHLEIAINKGSAKNLFGLSIGETIQIVFQ